MMTLSEALAKTDEIFEQKLDEDLLMLLHCGATEKELRAHIVWQREEYAMQRQELEAEIEMRMRDDRIRVH